MNIEVNITLRCHAGCRFCNRCCNRYAYPDSDMNMEQMQKFLGEIVASKHRFGHIALSGGEPTLHPNLCQFLEMCGKLVNDKIVMQVIVATNGSGGRKPPFKASWISWKARYAEYKKHLPWPCSPSDLGIPWARCRQPMKCGASLDKWGYLPCPPAASLVRLLGRTDLYRKKLPLSPWWEDDLCKHCTHAFPQEWKVANLVPREAESNYQPTKSFQVGLAEYKDGWDTANLEPF
jgi:hypothetical protein